MFNATSVLTVGCGLAGLTAARHLRFLGASVGHYLMPQCTDCDGTCDLPDDVLLRSYLSGEILSEKDYAELNTSSDIVIIDTGAELPWDSIFTNPVIVRIEGSSKPGSHDAFLEETRLGVPGTMGYEDSDPQPYGFLFAEGYTGVRAAGVALEAWLARERGAQTGPSSISVPAAIVESMDSPIEEVTFGGYQARRLGGQRAGLVVPYGFYPAGNGYVGLISAASWDVLAEVMEDPDLASDPRVATMESRLENMDFVLATLHAWLARYEHPDEVVAALGNRLSATTVTTLREIMSDDQFGLLESIDPAGTGPYRVNMLAQVRGTSLQSAPPRP